MLKNTFMIGIYFTVLISGAITGIVGGALGISVVAAILKLIVGG